jgi:hypothetical protein
VNILHAKRALSPELAMHKSQDAMQKKLAAFCRASI